MNYFVLSNNRVLFFPHIGTLSIGDQDESGRVIVAKTEDVVSCEDTKFRAESDEWYHAKNLGVQASGLLVEDCIVVSCEERDTLYLVPMAYLNIGSLGEGKEVLEVRLLREEKPIVNFKPIGVARITSAFGNWTKELFAHDGNIYARTIQFYA